MPIGCHVTAGVLQKQFPDVSVIWHLLLLALPLFWHHLLQGITFTLTVKWEVRSEEARRGEKEIDKERGRGSGVRRVAKVGCEESRGVGDKLRRADKAWVEKDMRRVEPVREVRKSWEEARRASKSRGQFRRGEKWWEVGRGETGWEELRRAATRLRSGGKSWQGLRRI